MLAALQQYATRTCYAELQASQNLAVTNATVQLQTLTVQQAAASVTLAQLQQQSAQMQASYWQQMLGSDIGSLEQSAISAHADAERPADRGGRGQRCAWASWKRHRQLWRRASPGALAAGADIGSRRRRHCRADRQRAGEPGDPAGQLAVPVRPRQRERADRRPADHDRAPTSCRWPASSWSSPSCRRPTRPTR